jgi:hypothetical protein
VLTGAAAGTFSLSYQNLQPYVRWHEWGNASITQIVTRPGHLGSDESPLVRILEDDVHGESVQLSDQDRRRIYLWLDGNAPFYGVYEADEQRAQQMGRAIPLPTVQ